MKKNLEKLMIKFFNFIYKKQAIAHKKRMEKLNKKILSGSICTEKYHMANGITLSIKNDENNHNQTHKEKIEKIVTQYIKEPKKLFDYIKGAKTPIYKIKNADKILSLIGEKEGFVLPKKGFRAVYLNLVLNKKVSFKTSEMFVLRTLDVNIYAFIYQFYNWYCYKMKLDGYDIKTQEKFKHIFEICETAKIDELDFDEILNLKTAIKRDIEAIDFVKNITKKYAMAKKNLDKIKQGKKVCV